MRRLPCWIRLGNLRTWQPIAKIELPEESLALPFPKLNAVVFFQARRELGAVPEIALQALGLGFVTQPFAHIEQVFIFEFGLAATAGSIAQGSQALLLKAVDPVLNRARCITQKMGRLSAAHALSDKQHAVESVIIARQLVATNFVLKNQHHRLRIGELK